MVRNSFCFYPLGYPVAIEGVHANQSDEAWTQEALEAARESWGGSAARFDGRAVRVQIRARHGPAPGTAPPRFRSRPEWIQLVWDAANRGAFVPGARTGRLHITSGLLEDRERFRRQMLEPLVLAALDHVYFTPLHAACVTRAERSILLCGDSGAGKSTLAYACARRGWTLVSDDAVHLTPLENTVAGGSAVIRLREPARALFPELRKAIAGVAPNGKPAIEIDARAHGWDVERFANPSHIIFLSRVIRSRGAGARRAGAARLRAYPRHLALAYFLKYLWHCDPSGHARRLRQLLGRGAHALEYEDVDAGVDALESLPAKP